MEKAAEVAKTIALAAMVWICGGLMFLAWCWILGTAFVSAYGWYKRIASR